MGWLAGGWERVDEPTEQSRSPPSGRGGAEGAAGRSKDGRSSLMTRRNRMQPDTLGRSARTSKSQPRIGAKNGLFEVGTSRLGMLREVEDVKEGRTS